MDNLNKKDEERKSNAGRKPKFIDDIGVNLSVTVPSKQKDNMKKVVLAMRKEYEIKK